MTRVRWYVILLLAGAGLGLTGHGAYIHAKAWLAQVLIRQAWSQTLEDQQPRKPWPWADTWPVARLKAPAQDVDLMVLAGDSGRTLAFGPGLHLGTAGPGARGPVLISAHRDTHFRFLQDLKAGEDIELQDARGQWHRYYVTGAEVVHESDALRADPADSVLIMITCYPFDALIPGGPWRYVVYARLG
ncbi:MAG: class GN sortase [Pseudomonadota bacterium]